MSEIKEAILYYLGYLLIWGCFVIALNVTYREPPENVEVIFYSCDDFILKDTDFCIKDDEYVDRLMQKYRDEIDKTAHSYYIETIGNDIMKNAST